jgi:hypothetical protein
MRFPLVGPSASATLTAPSLALLQKGGLPVARKSFEDPIRRLYPEPAVVSITA